MTRTKMALIAAGVVTLAIIGAAEQPAPVSSGASGEWCAGATRDLIAANIPVMASNEQTNALITKVTSRCRPGDVLTVPLNNSGVDWLIIPQLCDFSKAMPVSSGSMLSCVITTRRSSRY